MTVLQLVQPAGVRDAAGVTATRAAGRLPDVRPTLEIRLLGAFDLRADGATLPPLESARARSLLAHLLLHRGTATPRERLAALLWPESTDARARTNLRHVLHTLRRALPDDRVGGDDEHPALARRAGRPDRRRCVRAPPGRP